MAIERSSSSGDGEQQRTGDDSAAQVYGVYFSTFVCDYLNSDLALHGVKTKNGGVYRVDPGKLAAAFEHAGDAMLAANPAATEENRYPIQDEDARRLVHVLATGIGRAAVAAHIVHEDTPLTGPQLLMLCEDLGQAARARGERGRTADDLTVAYIGIGAHEALLAGGNLRDACERYGGQLGFVAQAVSHASFVERVGEALGNCPGVWVYEVAQAFGFEYGRSVVASGKSDFDTAKAVLANVMELARYIPEEVAAAIDQESPTHATTTLRSECESSSSPTM